MSSLTEDLPLALPPPGVQANFVDPVSRAWWIYVTAGICLPLMILFASIRLYAKLHFLRARTWDDFACVVGFVGGCTYICLTVALVSLGAYGHHIWDFTISGLSLELIRLTLVNEVIYGPSIWFIKVTLLLLFLELFGQIRWLKWLAWSGIVVMGLFYFASMIVYIVLCAPHGGQSQLDYLAAISAPKCENQSLSIVMGVFNIFSDLYILCIPFPAVWSLQMPRRRKIGICAIFLTGIAACISSNLSLVYRIKISQSNDTTWNVMPQWVVNVVEFTSGFIVSCMPAAAALYRHVRPQITGLIGSYKQRLRGYGPFTDSYELHGASSRSNLGSQQTAGYVKTPINAPGQGQTKADLSEGESDLDEKVKHNEMGIRKITHVEIGLGPRVPSSRTEVWGMPQGDMV